MIAPEGSYVNPLREAISSSYTFELTDWLKQYPEEGALMRMLRLSAPEMLIVDFTEQPCLGLHRFETTYRGTLAR